MSTAAGPGPSSYGTPPAEPSTVRTASGPVAIVGLVVTVVVVPLFVWFGLRMRAGARWSRTATAVLAALGAFGALATGATALVSPVPAAAGGFGTVLQVVSGLVLVAYLVFLFRRPSGEWFAVRR